MSAIGDCLVPGTIQAAVYGGRKRARQHSYTSFIRFTVGVNFLPVEPAAANTSPPAPDSQHLD